MDIGSGARPMPATPIAPQAPAELTSTTVDRLLTAIPAANAPLDGAADVATLADGTAPPMPEQGESRIRAALSQLLSELAKDSQLTAGARDIDALLGDAIELADLRRCSRR